MKNNNYVGSGRPVQPRHRLLLFSSAFACCVGSLILPQPVRAQVPQYVIMQHNDLYRTGANVDDNVLTPANVNTNLFGKLFSESVDGKVYAQPLYVPGLTINSAAHNVVFVCTDSNSVYAFDADNGASLWHDNFGPPVPNGDVGGCGDMSPQIGITGTPAIDTNGSTLYVDSRTLSGSTYAHKLHALALTSGAEKFGGPVTISATVNGHSFNAHYQHQRPGLLLLNDVVYIAYGSDCDANTYWGWVLGYNMTTLQQVSAFNTAPTGTEGAIWSCGMAPAVDTNGNIFVITANGSFNANTSGGSNYSECFMKFTPTSGALKVADWFCPSNQATLSQNDEDLGSGGPVLIPGTDLVTGAGKEGILFLLSTTNMGHYSTTHNNVVEQFKAFNEDNHANQNPIYWQGPADQFLYMSAGSSQTAVYEFNGSTINTTPVAKGSETQGNPGGLSLSANGRANGVLWVVDDGNNGELHAYNANAAGGTLAETWNSQQYASRDSLGSYVKFVSPTIANQKVYQGTDGALVAYGLLFPPNFLAFEAEDLAFTPSGATAAVNFDTNSSGGEWIALNATGTGQSIQYPLPSIPAGTYQLQMQWKGNGGRGILSLAVDGNTVGGNLDQYSATQVYPTTTFANIALSAGTHTIELTVVGKNASSSGYELSADQFILTPTTLSFPAVPLSYTTSGASAAVNYDNTFPGGEWLALNATGTGQSITYTLPNVPADTYQVQMGWKGNTSRGILSLAVDGTTLGSNLDQYSATGTYNTNSFGNVVLSQGTHTIQLTVTGKNASSTGYELSTYNFILTGQ